MVDRPTEQIPPIGTLRSKSSRFDNEDHLLTMDSGMSAGKPIQLDAKGNRITVTGAVGLLGFRSLLATMHNLTNKAGYEDLVLDFSHCDAAYCGPMLSVCSEAMRLRRAGTDCELILPANIRLAGLFRNAGWANLIDPHNHAVSVSRAYKHVPAIGFCSPHEQNSAVNRLIDALLGSMTPLERSDLAAIEWSLNEITDNVMVHSGSDIGGLVQLSAHSFQKRVEIAVADAGEGIPTTLRRGNADITSDSVALERAIREGVTRDKTIGQGNGLFGSFEVTRASQGYFHIHSRYARLDFDKDELRIRSEQIPYHGTLVVACMDCSNPRALGDALRFGGKRHKPYDYVEYKYEDEITGEVVVLVAKEAQSFGSRVAGMPVRNKILNLIQMHPEQRVVIDFADVPLTSSSFADELVGKLFVEIGPLAFMKAIELRNVSTTVRSLLDRAIMQRSQSTASKGS